MLSFTGVPFPRARLGGKLALRTVRLAVFDPNAYRNTFAPAFNLNTIIPAIRAIFQEAGLSLINNNSEFLNHPELFTDGVHPTAEGAGMLADNVAAAITAP